MQPFGLLRGGMLVENAVGPLGHFDREVHCGLKDELRAARRTHKGFSGIKGDRKRNFYSGTNSHVGKTHLTMCMYLLISCILSNSDF